MNKKKDEIIHRECFIIQSRRFCFTCYVGSQIMTNQVDILGSDQAHANKAIHKSCDFGANDLRVCGGFRVL
jgi:hypothetical protein